MSLLSISTAIAWVFNVYQYLIILHKKLNVLNILKFHKLQRDFFFSLQLLLTYVDVLYILRQRLLVKRIICHDCSEIQCKVLAFNFKTEMPHTSHEHAGIISTLNV